VTFRPPAGLYSQGQPRQPEFALATVETTMTASTDFISETGQFRTELLAYCYRMLGSADEAEDLVQETYLRAWRSYDGFEGRSSVRTWLYRIATNACLTAIDRRGRRPLPSGLGAPGDDSAAPVPAGPEVPWLQPMPGALLLAEAADPAVVAASRAGLRLALVAAWQYLSARQRAVLILRDVLDWPAAQVADLLDTSTAAVNSALRRARAQLADVLPAENAVTEPAEPAQRAMLDQFMAAFVHADVAALAKLLRDDVVLEMPPLLTWFAGRDDVTGFFARQVFPQTQFRMVATVANGQPAAAAYHRDGRGRYQAHAITVLTMTTTGIARIDTFLDPALFPKFGLPQQLPAE
jgi:RNA polymerase sigma-70 factor (ECF subfamily)